MIEQELHDEGGDICLATSKSISPRWVLIIGKALVNLRSGQLRETICPHRFNRLAALKQADDIVHGNPRFLDDGGFPLRTPAARTI